MAKGNKKTATNNAPKALDATNFDKAVAFLAIHEYVEKIYINKAGEYHLQPVEGFNEYLASDLTGAAETSDEDTVDYVLTEEDFINNPDFEKQGLKVGDTIQIPAK